MIDPYTTMRAYLLLQTSYVAVVGDRIYAGPEFPPVYRPADGPALLFHLHGGKQNYSSTILTAPVRFCHYAITHSMASDAANALYDVLDSRSGDHIVQAQMVDGPRAYSEPKTLYPYIQTMYIVQFRIV